MKYTLKSRKSLWNLISLCIFFGLAPRVGLTEGASLSWEVANRFGPFEAYRDIGKDPVAIFNIWKMNPNKRFEDWHRDLWQSHEDNGSDTFVSPYAELIRAAPDNRKNALWDSVKDMHRERIAALARGRGPIKISATSVITAESCVWQFEGHEAQTAPCQNHMFEVDLSDPAGMLVVKSHDGVQSAEARIEVKHRLIVGLGESYSAGQGNPDIPARWAAWTPETRPETLDVNWLKKPRKFLENGSAEARWLDAECYRSFFNYETLTALKIASDEPHSFVSFLHYACSGAEVFDGLLNPQGIPKDSNRANDFGQKEKPSWYHARSQLHSMIMDLCSNPGDVRPYPRVLRDKLIPRNQSHLRHAFLRHNNFTGEVEPRHIDGSFKTRTYAAHRNSDEWGDKVGEAYPTDGLPACDGQLAKPDLVLLGIGGNDGGFESIVRYYVVPNTYKMGIFNYIAAGEICPQSRNLGINKVARRACGLKPYNTGALVPGTKNWRCANSRCQPLQERLVIAYEAIINLTGITADRLVTPVYPDPFRSSDLPLIPLDEELPNYAGLREKGRGPVLQHGKDGAAAGGQAPNPLSQWNAAALGLGKARPIAREWSFDITRQEAELILREAEGIRSQQRDAAKRTGVSLVLGTRDSFLSSPWTAGQHGQLANAPPPNNWDPSEWEPYAYEARARAARTYNDSVMTQQDLDEEVDFRGAAHPNLTGHRLLAQTISPCVTAILNEKGTAPCRERH
ncbi:hypothetical protein [Pseudooceanicola nanhaiensis]|uniref:hypothetical protein n=1 Tax=Pseudooceanicola nanhaiensis TaxID=375761 RepID=UPI001CD578CE|nr:hypothetical protein [Pseudooceanicola nanhaiensis]MCA0922960.1 hypothetical protein [Pseudooceanicola nanhaiensis]